MLANRTTLLHSWQCAPFPSSAGAQFSKHKASILTFIESADVEELPKKEVVKASILSRCTDGRFSRPFDMPPSDVLKEIGLLANDKGGCSIRDCQASILSWITFFVRG